MIGDIFFVHNKNLIGNLIRKVSGGYYNHVGIVVSETEIVEATYKGIKLTKIEKFENLRKKNKCDYCVGYIKDITEDDRYSAISFAYCQIGSKYDYLQFLSLFFFFLFNLKRNIEPIECENAFICSELCVEAYETRDVYFNLDINNDLITPHDLEISERIILEK